VRSFAFLACVVVVYESFRKVRFQDIIAKTMLNDFVAEAVYMISRSFGSFTMKQL
jgi:hypothetical protein